MTMPNFLIIGAAKSGTTSLYSYLIQHPQVYASPLKEPRFFALEGEELDFRGPGDLRALRSSVTDLGAYRALFDGVTEERAIGEASPVYLMSEKAPRRIAHYIPDAKLIAVLRDPAQRAYSGYLHLVRDGYEPLDDFSQALREEETRIERNYAPHWHYKEAGFYHAHLSRYLEHFDERQLRVYFYEDLMNDPAGVLRDVFGFLGVDEDFLPDMSFRHNPSGVPRNKTLNAFLMRSNPIKTLIKPLVPSGIRERAVSNVRTRNLRRPPRLCPDVRRRLIEVYREDTLKLQGLVGRDLSGWLE